MTHRYFIEKPIDSDRAVLVGAEAHHLLHVMRAGVGAQVTLFDGSGYEFAAAVDRLGRSEAQLSILGRQHVNREPSLALTLGAALPKGDRQKWLVEKAVELGVARIVPLHTARGVAQPVDHALARLRRSVIEASKQCGRNRLMEIEEPQAWSDFIRQASGETWRFVAHPQTAPAADAARASLSSADFAAIPRAGRVVAAIGPEGGFTDDEVTAAAALGWRLVDLGPRILRVETAALCLVARIVQ